MPICRKKITAVIAFCSSFYITLGVTYFGEKSDFASLSTFCVYIFSLLFGLYLAKSSGRLAAAVSSGNPQMGLGDIAQGIRSMSHAMHVADHMRQSAAKGVHAAAGGLYQGAVNAHGVAQAANFARNQTVDELKSAASRDSGGGSDYAGTSKDIARAGRSAAASTMGRAMGQSVVDKAYKHWTGQDLDHSAKGNDGSITNTGFVKLGQTFVDEHGYERKATMADVMEQAKLRGEESKEEARYAEYWKNKSRDEGSRKIPDEDGLGLGL